MKTTVFKKLSTKELILTKPYTNEIYFDKEELIIKKNSALHSIYFVKKGMIKFRDSEQKLCFLIGENDFIGLSSIFNENTKKYDAYATPDSIIVQIDKIIIKKLIRTNPDFTEYIMECIGKRVLFFVEHLSFRNKNISGALASFLLIYNTKNCLHDITRKEIGEIIGFSRENVSKSLKTFINDGLVEDGKKLKIKNEEALEKIRKFG